MRKMMLILLVSVSLFAIEQKQEGVGWLDIFSYDDSSKNKRVLIIGDSIVRQYANNVKKELKGKYTITRLSTSKSICSKHFINQLAVAMTQPYSIILINNGLHDFFATNDEYKQCYKKSIDYLLHTNPNAKVMLVTTTGVKGINEREKIVQKRNISLREISQIYKLPIVDLYTEVHGKNELWKDAYHFKMGGGKITLKQSCKLNSRCYS